MELEIRHSTGSKDSSASRVNCIEVGTGKICLQGGEANALSSGLNEPISQRRGRHPWLQRETRNTILPMRGLHHRAGLVLQGLGILSVVLLVQGCPSKAPPPGVRFPITSGSHHTLPTAQQRILVWGEPPLTEVALEWLLSHHYSAIMTPERDSFQTPQASRRFADRTVALAVAKEMKADFVLFLEREDSQEGALIEPQCGPLFSVNVNVRGVSRESGDVTLRGNAHYPHCVDLSGETFRSLTCQALATAWGLRPPGQLDIPSGLMCTAGQTEPIPIR